MAKQGTESVDGPSGDVPALSEVDTSVLHMSPVERTEEGVTDEDVRAALLAVTEHGDAEDKDLRGVHLPAVTFDRLLVDGTDRHALDLRNATVEGTVSAEFATVRIPVVLDGATVGSFALDNAHFEGELSCSGATVTGETDAFEAQFDGDVHFDDATFEGPVSFDEAVFDDDTDFDRATFAETARFRGAEFHGDSNLLDDNVSFTEAMFTAGTDFRQAEFGFAVFDDAVFEGDAEFEGASFAGDGEFNRCAFRGRGDFDESRFREDAGFEDATFHGEAHFRGATFEGGDRAMDDDATFAGVRFADEAVFRLAMFRFVDFDGATFEERADFEGFTVTADADFSETTFAGEADFDEARFGEDADFSGVRFGGRCAFRGVEVSGGANYLEDDITFEGTRFEADADFHNAQLTSANFMDTAFGGEVEFSGSTFSDRIDLRAQQVEGDAFVNFTRASIRTGRIVQPADGWVRYDMTLASVGDIDLEVERSEDSKELLDYFRFCRTEFDEFADHEFDFSDHRDYLDRNGWNIHHFDEPPGGSPDYALEMTPEVVETTYLKAKQAAGEAGDMKVAGEFRVKRQQYSRAKSLSVVRDPSVDPWARVKNSGRVVENYFLGITCGHGMRPIRIGFAFVLAPLLFVVPYAFGGPAFETGAGQLASVGELFTAEGQAIFYKNVHFSYISYTTIGYGNIGPKGALARLLAGSEAYLNVVLSALLVYALVKRSEL